MVAIGAHARVWTRVAAAVASGVCVWASFPPVGWWWAAIPGVAMLCLAVGGSSARTAALLGFVHGATFLVLLLTFVRVFGIDAWLVLAAGEALFFVPLTLALRVVMRLTWWPVAAGAVWVAEEAIRDRVPFGGFPWGRLADAQAGGPIGRLAALGGAPLVTFATALAGALLAAAVMRVIQRRSGAPAPATGRRSGAGAAVLAGAVVVVLAGLAVPVPVAGTAAGGPSTLRAALVQGNVPRLGLDAFQQGTLVTGNQMRQTLALARAVRAGRVPRPQVVIWPENSSDHDPYVDPIARAMIDRAVTVVGVPTLVGAVLNAPDDKLQNVGIVWSPTTGPGETYVKQHLLPFGEYLPFRAELSKWIGRFSLLPRDFTPGHRPGLLTLGPTKIADVICFEIADDGIVRSAVRAGGRIIVEQTNDASYEHAGDSGRGGESAQQLQIARLRAIESGRSVLVVSTSGVSAAIAPNGQVLARSRIFSPATLDVTVPLRDPLTLADRVGMWPEIALCALALAAVVAGTLTGRRRRSAGSEGSPATAAAPVDVTPAGHA